VPVPLITIKESENPESHGAPFENIQHEMLIEKMESTLQVLIKNGKTKEEAAALLLSIEPFDKYPQYIEQIIENL
jgi:hypothetical protein